MTRLSVDIDERILGDLDRAAADSHQSRDEAVREAIELGLQQLRKKTLERQYQKAYGERPVTPDEIHVIPKTGLSGVKMRRGEVRYYKFASPDKRRPVLLLSLDEAIRVLNDIVVAPITTTIRNLPTFVLLSEADKLCAANMDQIQLAPKHLLSEKITELGAARIAEVDRALMIALGVQDA